MNAALETILARETHDAGLPSVRLIAELNTEPLSASLAFISSATLNTNAEALRQELSAGNFGSASMALRSMNDDPAAIGMSQFARDSYCAVTAVVVGTCAGLAASTVMTPVGGGIVGAIIGTQYGVACVEMIQTDEDRAAKHERIESAKSDLAQWNTYVELTTNEKERAYTAHQQAQANDVEATYNANNPPSDATEAEKEALKAVAADAQEKEREAAAALERAEENEREAKEGAAKAAANVEKEKATPAGQPLPTDETTRSSVPPAQLAAIWQAIGAIRRQQTILPSPEGSGVGLSRSTLPALGPLIYPQFDAEFQGGGGVRGRPSAIDPSPDAVAVVISPIVRQEVLIPSTVVAARLTGDLATQELAADGKAVIRITGAS